MTPNGERRHPDRPNDWLFDTLDRMEKTENRHAAEQRMSIANVLQRLEEHIEEDRLVENRVFKMETQREEEAKNRISQDGETRRRATWIAAAVSAILNIMALGLAWLKAK